MSLVRSEKAEEKLEIDAYRAKQETVNDRQFAMLEAILQRIEGIGTGPHNLDGILTASPDCLTKD